MEGYHRLGDPPWRVRRSNHNPGIPVLKSFTEEMGSLHDGKFVTTDRSAGEALTLLARRVSMLTVDN